MSINAHHSFRSAAVFFVVHGFSCCFFWTFQPKTETFSFSRVRELTVTFQRLLYSNLIGVMQKQLALISLISFMQRYSLMNKIRIVACDILICLHQGYNHTAPSPVPRLFPGTFQETGFCRSQIFSTKLPRVLKNSLR